VGIEPELHLSKHELVDLFQDLDFLDWLSLLLIQIRKREFMEVFWVDFLHDVVKSTRCDEFIDICGISWQFFERAYPIDE
jgi:hypothetical protein